MLALNESNGIQVSNSGTGSVLLYNHGYHQNLVQLLAASNLPSVPWREKQMLITPPKKSPLWHRWEYVCQERDELLFSRWSKDMPELRLQITLEKVKCLQSGQTGCKGHRHPINKDESQSSWEGGFGDQHVKLGTDSTPS